MIVSNIRNKSQRGKRWRLVPVRAGTLTEHRRKCLGSRESVQQDPIRFCPILDYTQLPIDLYDQGRGGPPFLLIFQNKNEAEKCRILLVCAGKSEKSNSRIGQPGL